MADTTRVVFENAASGKRAEVLMRRGEVDVLAEGFGVDPALAVVEVDSPEGREGAIAEGAFWLGVWAAGLWHAPGGSRLWRRS